MKSWKNIISFTYPHEAHLAQLYLNSEGIETILKDEMTVQVYGFYSNAIGGVKLMVQEDDYERALASLETGGYVVNHPVLDEVFRVPVATKADKKYCPFCQSDNIKINKEPNIVVIILYVILGVIFPIFRLSYKCFDCGKQWKFQKAARNA
ncbi:putative signal transducing protein [Sunxiuqinia dokdonensis]|uniref:putative signal transducing protein n=1 Tax=Sunxiuqinia dokdonensis TaxID=1409788 RepID=UPI00069D0D15|nr:DUF2007 domain-containing protein [Sunxiuqinia dokdonensis]